jgi:periplasmic mercuric ion binding protein
MINLHLRVIRYFISFFKIIIMKTVKFLFAAFFAVTLNISLTAQMHDHSNMGESQSVKSQTKTASFLVNGVCELCKARIESAAKSDGLESADWSIDTHMLTLVYDPAKTSVDNVQKKIAAAGHDTEKYKATDEAYSKLPSCCKYDRNKLSGL